MTREVGSLDQREYQFLEHFSGTFFYSLEVRARLFLKNDICPLNWTSWWTDRRQEMGLTGP